jgi:hypothetical protein
LGSAFAVSRGGGVRLCGGSCATGGSSSTGSGGGGSTTLASITRGGTCGTSRFGRSDGDFAWADAHAALAARHPIAITKSNFLISTRLNLQSSKSVGRRPAEPIIAPRASHAPIVTD